MAEAKEVKKGKGGKPAGRPSKKESASAPQALDEGSEESKFKPRLRDMYRDQVVPALMKEFAYKNVMQVPRLERIVLNVGMSEAIQNVKLFESAATELATITGQKADHYQGEESHRRLQASARHADRDEGHASESPHV
jgi:large subunit ribosomal protein L5